MIKEKTIYITEDGIRFDNVLNARSHEEVYSRLKFDEEKWLGERLKVPGYCEPPCLETIQHDQKGLLQVTLDLVTLLNINFIMNEDNVDTWFNDCISYISDIKESNDIDTQVELWDNLTSIVKRQSEYYYYKDETESTNKQASYCIVYQISKRLYNTSWKTGIEYPSEGGYTPAWKYREDKWETYVKEEKAYIAGGGKYR